MGPQGVHPDGCFTQRDLRAASCGPFLLGVVPCRPGSGADGPETPARQPLQTQRPGPGTRSRPPEPALSRPLSSQPRGGGELFARPHSRCPRPTRHHLTPASSPGPLSSVRRENRPERARMGELGSWEARSCRGAPGREPGEVLVGRPGVRAEPCVGRRLTAAVSLSFSSFYRDMGGRRGGGSDLEQIPWRGSRARPLGRRPADTNAPIKGRPTGRPGAPGSHFPFPARSLAVVPDQAWPPRDPV